MARVKITTGRYKCGACGWVTGMPSSVCGRCGSENTIRADHSPPPEAPPEREEPEENDAHVRAQISEDNVVSLADAIAVRGGKPRPRFKTGLPGFDGVLGGGIARRSVVLLSGVPGCGKSTLLLTALVRAVDQYPKLQALYASGEENSGQIAERAMRVGLASDRVHLLATEKMDLIHEAVMDLGIRLVLVDSAQTVVGDPDDGEPGSLKQTVKCVRRLVWLAHAKGGPRCTVLTIGHASKDGSAAGPNTLRHLVDTVLSVESDESSGMRVVRAEKNRFGPSGEVSMYGVESDGIRELLDPGADLLSERTRDTAGSLLFAGAEDDARAMLVELQALVAPPQGQSGTRTVVGIDRTKLATVLAILGRTTDVPIAGQDVYVNVSRGMRATEPAVALPLALSLLSSLRDVSVPRDLVAFGEIALDGSVRSVPRARDRLREAARLGMRRALVPHRNHEQDGEAARETGITTLPIGHVADLLNYLEIWKVRGPSA